MSPPGRAESSHPSSQRSTEKIRRKLPAGSKRPNKIDITVPSAPLHCRDCCNINAKPACTTSQTPESPALVHQRACRRLRNFLRRRGAFPKAHRAAAWQKLLSLPRNEAAYAALGAMPQIAMPPAMQKIVSALLSEGGDDEKILVQVLGRLANWSPALIEMPCLPDVISAFLEVFRHDEVLLFEACAAFFLNWGESWVTGPWIHDLFTMPRDVLEDAWAAATSVDQELARHLEACAARGCRSQPADAKCSILWPLIQTLCRKCLSNDIWLVLWDHLITLWREPKLLGLAAFAVLRCIREVLLSLPICSSDQLLNILQNPQVIPIPHLLEELYSLRKHDAVDSHQMLHKRHANRMLTQDVDKVLIPPGSSYPPLPCSTNAVLDFLVQDRCRARAEIQDAHRDLDKAAAKYKAIETIALGEAKVHEERAEILRLEKIRRASAAKEDGLLEDELQRHAGEVLTTRLDRLDMALNAVNASMEQQIALHSAEKTRLADERVRQHRRVDAENAAWSQEVELAAVEALATQQLSDIARHHRVEEAARELRQKVRADLLKRDCEDEATRQSQRVEDEAERARMRMTIERQLEEHQWELADSHRREVEMQLKLDDRMRQLQYSEVWRERAVRATARSMQRQREARLKALQTQLSEEAHKQAGEQDAVLEKERRRHERRLQKQRRLVEEQHAQTRQSLKQQRDRLHCLELDEEHRQFELRMQRALQANEAAMRESEMAIHRELASLNEVCTTGERGEALDAQRRDLQVRRGLYQHRARRAASELLHQDRQLFVAGIESSLPAERLLSTSESEAEHLMNNSSSRDDVSQTAQHRRNQSPSGSTSSLSSRSMLFLSSPH